MKLFALLLPSIVPLALAVSPSSTTSNLDYSFKCGQNVFFYCGNYIENGKDCNENGATVFLQLDRNSDECLGLINVVETGRNANIYQYKCPVVGDKQADISHWTVYNCDEGIAVKTDDKGSDECNWRNPPSAGQCGGDPHFRTYDGTEYSYHGECDLIMVRSPSFGGNLGLDLHIRTKGMGAWSLISNAVLRIADDVFEFENDGSHYINGESIVLPYTMAGRYTVTKERTVVEKEVNGSLKTIDKTVAKISFGNGKSIQFTRVRKGIMYVRVNIYLPDAEGMLGVHRVKGMVGRDGHTALSDPDEMGAQWQVNGTEPMLFRNLREPQFPSACKSPSASSGRRLRMSEMEYETANKACAAVGDNNREFCIQYVLLSGDSNSAVDYLFGEAF